MNLQPCRLCKTPAALKDSHIFPEFFWRIAEERVPKGRSAQLQPCLSVMFTDPQKRDIDLKQRGRWDKTVSQEKLLCGACEDRLSSFETHARLRLFGNRQPHAVRKGTFRAEITTNYAKFRLFELSLLWRASVASAPFYENCKLPQELGEALRQTLLTGTSPLPNLIGCSLLDLRYEDADFTKAIDNPRRLVEPSREIVLLTMGGYCWAFWIRPETPPAGIAKTFLQPDGTRPVVQIDGSPFLQYWANAKKNWRPRRDSNPQPPA